MKRLMVSALAVFALLASIPAQAAGFASPEGFWEIEYHDSHYRLSYCDGDGGALCAELVWLAESASTSENLPYLNKMVVKHAKRLSPYRWKGELALMGESVEGTIKQVNNDEIDITGCKFLVLCRTYKLYRLAPGASPADTGSQPTQ